MKPARHTLPRVQFPHLLRWCIVSDPVVRIQSWQMRSRLLRHVLGTLFLLVQKPIRGRPFCVQSPMHEISASKEVDDVLSIEAEDVEANSPLHVTNYEELVEVVT